MLERHHKRLLDSMVKLQRQAYHPPAAQPHPQNSLSIKDHLRDIFKELLPVATHWQNIGTLLDVPQEKLESIKHDYNLASDCLREMVKAWLKMIDPPPTWQQLVDAVASVDPARAEAICRKYC